VVVAQSRAHLAAQETCPTGWGGEEANVVGTKPGKDLREERV
jgi:hypothetical protein